MQSKYHYTDFLSQVEGWDGYATDMFYGYITGPEIEAVKGDPKKLKKLMVSRLKKTYKVVMSKIDEAFSGDE